jgi:hypothetical protein
MWSMNLVGTGNMSLLSSFTGRHSAQFCALCLGSGLGLGPKDQFCTENILNGDASYGECILM